MHCKRGPFPYKVLKKGQEAEEIEVDDLPEPCRRSSILAAEEAEEITPEPENDDEIDEIDESNVVE